MLATIENLWFCAFSGSCVLQRLSASGDQGRGADLGAERAEGDQRAHRRRPRIRHGQERGQSVSTLNYLGRVSFIVAFA